jgi:hypothetical protein
MRSLVGIVAVLGALLASCHSSPVSKPAVPVILAQWSGPYGGVDAPATRLIKTSAEWSALWQQLGRDPPRAFDPGKETAVALFLGQRRTGGYRIEVSDVRRQDDQLVVEYREDTPSRGAAVPQVLTAPWAVAVIPSTALPIVFRGTHAKLAPANDR